MGPFVRREDNPLLETDPQRSIFGPGHHSIAPGAFNDLLMFYHSKINDQDYAPRRTRYVPVEFDEDGQMRLKE